MQFGIAGLFYQVPCDGTERFEWECSDSPRYWTVYALSVPRPALLIVPRITELGPDTKATSVLMLLYKRLPFGGNFTQNLLMVVFTIIQTVATDELDLVKETGNEILPVKRH